ncbi:MAG TPA: hypothetical protein EYN91_21340 [Candidatus Melainabacteria bacterium]|jgi:hypothetical protein|nr:hypothetical protein [Candidatus Melainabacteria bacterium]HIN67071.1 hypothetical protein [Candidatus Obscuribacterales bacterium]
MTPKKVEKNDGPSLPLNAMFIMAALGFVIVGASFEVIKYYPLPASVDPYFDWVTGGCWGLVVGAVAGLVLGYLTDDKYFEQK